MTVEEMRAREAIRDLMARYTIAGDRLRVDDFVAVFAPDGTVESEGVPEADLFRYAGHAAIRDWITRWANPVKGARTHGASFVRHHLSTSQIDLDGPDAARARTYWTACTDIGPDHGGVYVDRFARIGDRWLIAHRRIRLDWRVPGSLFGGAIARSRG